jgi:1,2-diacylglycerol 3-beta-galactosyltransferase
VVDKRAGVWAPTPEQVVETLRDWIENPEIRAQVAATSKSLGRPDAAKNIAHKIISMVKP